MTDVDIYLCIALQHKQAIRRATRGPTRGATRRRGARQCYHAPTSASCQLPKALVAGTCWSYAQFAASRSTTNIQFTYT